MAVKETTERLMDVAEAHMRSAGHGGFSGSTDTIRSTSMSCH
jgi:hypothetical protein